MDGTIYAAVASNLSQGNGSLWSLKFSETIMNPFYEHPPLAIWLESIFHKLFLDSYLSERFYSLLMWMMNGWLIVLIWKELKPKSEMAWAPLLLWACIPLVVWSFSNNMLENTMGVFVSASVLFTLVGLRKKWWLWSLLSGVILVFAFLSKGFVGLFPLAFPALIALFLYDRRSLKEHVGSQLLMLVGFAIALLPLMITPESWSFIETYFEHQVQNSVEKIQTVSHRAKILEYFLTQLLIPLGVIGILTLFLKRKLSNNPRLKNKKETMLFFILALCGVLPIMISLKQRDFYIVTVFPLAMIGLVLLFENVFEFAHAEIKAFIKQPMRVASILLTITIGTSIGASFYYKRDKDVLQGAEMLANSDYAGSTMNCSNNIRYDWGTMAYLSRFSKISVDVGYDSPNKLKFYNEGENEEQETFNGIKIVLNKD